VVRGLPAVPFASVVLFFALLATAPAQSPEPTSAGFARVHRAVSTLDPAAATAFDDGLTLLYAFNPEEARRAFRRAAAADPGFALAWWGIAMSYGPNINTSYDPSDQRSSREAIGQAQKREAGASPVERALIEAAAKRFAFVHAGDGDRSARAYRDAMAAAAATFPSDDDVETLAAEAEMDVHPWSYYRDDGSATDGTPGAIARLQDVLARDPAHIGANHLLIHATEESPHPEDALPAARRLAALNFEPAAEHLIHMPAHTFMRVGAYHEAGEANARAIDAYDIYLAGDPAGHTDYFGHDCSFGVDAFMMSGEYGRARPLAGLCRHGDNGLQAIVDWRFRKWDALAADKPASDFLRGMALAQAGHTQLARERLAVLRKGSDTTAKIESDLVTAAIARASGDAAGEISALELAVAAQDTFGYSEPPTFFFPVRESLGGALLRNGRPADAERVFRADLERNRENPRALFGLEEALAREARTDEARTVHERFLRAWAHADTPLTIQEL
jgi:tetratricopeptide (TPR) repeat protein